QRLEAGEATLLKQHYLGYRRRAYHLFLENRKAVVNDEEFVTERKQVSDLWHRLMFTLPA
ncbi:MAG: hypothetical protein HOA22_10055, partial [Gammaproteobacteria bacterium]|nr:hypothetical protein [Gammaproteobacteria bacterium]